MRFSSHPFTSVTRWLIVVVGCAVLETAQLMRAEAPEAPVPCPCTGDSDISARQFVGGFVVAASR
jgi:hypothetical protein